MTFPLIVLLMFEIRNTARTELPQAAGVGTRIGVVRIAVVALLAVGFQPDFVTAARTRDRLALANLITVRGSTAPRAYGLLFLILLRSTLDIGVSGFVPVPIKLLAARESDCQRSTAGERCRIGGSENKAKTVDAERLGHLAVVEGHVDDGTVTGGTELGDLAFEDRAPAEGEGDVFGGDRKGCLPQAQNEDECPCRDDEKNQKCEYALLTCVNPCCFAGRRERHKSLHYSGKGVRTPYRKPATNCNSRSH